MQSDGNLSFAHFAPVTVKAGLLWAFVVASSHCKMLKIVI